MAETTEATQTTTEGAPAPTLAQKAAAMVTGVASMTMDKAAQIDQQYNVTEKVAQAAQATMAKAQEIDAKYDITNKAQNLLTTTTEAATNMDSKLGITDKIQQGVSKVKEMDKTYGVSEKATAMATSADAKLGLSKRASEMDVALGVSDTASKVGTMINEGAKVVTAKMTSLMSMSTYAAKLGEDEVKVVLVDGTVKIGDAEAETIEAGMTAVAEGATVTLTTKTATTLVFTTPEVASAFVTKFTQLASPAEEEVVAAEQAQA